jgi:hypothetical protein
VIAAHLQGHGFTADIDRPISYEAMGDDVAALITELGFTDADCIQPAHIVEMFGLLGGGRRDAGLDGSGRPVTRLAVVPGATQYDVLTFKEVSDLVAPFLDAELPDRV